MSGVNSQLVIKQVTSDIITFGVPFLRFGFIPFGGRSTAIRLRTGDVWLLASHPLCEQTRETLDRLGPVKYIVVADREHTLYTSQYVELYPAAKLYVPQHTKETWQKAGKDELVSRITFTFGNGEPDPLDRETGGEMKCEDFAQSHANNDIAFFHAPSRTLIEADLLFNLPPTKQHSKSNVKTVTWIFTAGLQPGTAFQRFFCSNVLCKNKVQMARSAKIVSSWDFDRIIPCHGNIIETGGKEAWDSTFINFYKVNV